MLLHKAVNNFLISLEANGRASRTIDTYAWRLGGFQEFIKALGVADVEALCPEHIDAWAISLRRQSERWVDHPTRPAEAGGLSPASIAGRIQAVKTFLAWCHGRGYLDSSPAAHLKTPHVELDSSERVMRPDDFLRLVDQAETLATGGQRLAVRDYALVTFIYETGCRPGESCEAIVRGKTGTRRVLFADTTAGTLRNWLGVRPDCDHDFVFVGRTGTPLTVSGLYQVFRRLAKNLGVVGRYNPHSVRHLVGQTFTDKTNLELETRSFVSYDHGSFLRSPGRRACTSCYAAFVAAE
jgi:integrase/recombinase XerC